MRIALLLSLFVSCAAGVFAQTTPAAPPQTGQPAASKPASPAPAGRGTAAPPAARGSILLTVLTMQGRTLEKVRVDLSGPATRNGETDSSGQLTFSMLQAGTYRLRFSGEAITTFEREVTVPANKPVSVDVPLSPAPPPKEVVKLVEVPAPAPAPAAPVAVTGPIGQPQIASLVELAEKALDKNDRKQPSHESLIACSGNTRTMLVLLNQDQSSRLYEGADSLFYVVAGEGFLRINNKESPLAAGGFASVPRATSFVIGRRGRNPLVVLSILSGEACETAK